MAYKTRYFNQASAFLIIFLFLFSCFFSCSSKLDRDILKIGISEEPETLNIWLASDTNSRKILSLVYQNLYIRDPETLKLIPWLAKADPLYDPEDLSYTVKLRNVKWSDGSDLTADDVVFTVNLIKQFKVPQYISKWRFVKKIEAVDKRTVKFYLSKPKAIFLTRSLGIPIVSKKEWSLVVKKALSKKKSYKALINHKIENPLGCGPFVLKERRCGAYIFFEKNRFFFGKGKTIKGRKLGPYIDKLLFKVYRSADVAILALKKGSIDYYWACIQPGHVDGLSRDQNIKVFVSKKSAFYYMGFNLRKTPFSDPYLRRAIAVLIDKKFIVSRILQGFATEMSSVVPKGNEFWHNPDLPMYGAGLTRDERIQRAYKLLALRGYSWEIPPVNDKKEVVSPSTIRLLDGKPMEEFTILTPPAGYDPHRAACGTIIQEWLKDLGLPVTSRPMSFGALLDKVKARHDFDTFILGYGMLSLDPDYLRSFFYSKNNRTRGWNMSGYNNKEFDKLADASLAEMNNDKRRQLIWEMQSVLLNDIPYFPLYNPTLIEAVNNKNFTGWVKMVGGIGNIWSLCSVKPAQGTSKK
ncbi:MAG: ABC transporter substrate-binding protein [Thermodesulfobacteriota bacterium]|nr:ABC transporter substrate-binding protein [Thermodesulfobacteriota bacterium]